MGKIICAIDFSDCSINAFKHALSIAQKCKCELLLVWVRKPASQKEKYENHKDDPVEGIKKRFEALIEEYKPQLQGTKLNYRIRKGKVYKEIAAEAKSSKAMLVVADDVTLEALYSALAPVEASLDRKISPTLYTKKEFDDRRAAGNPFLTRVLEGEYLVLIGSADDAA